ncbi:MAG: hypothetical protein K2X03_30280 [Bryobacteraceae bacterium]|nr:hypothetical protein [Bryobacteraceae bacterium]
MPSTPVTVRLEAALLAQAELIAKQRGITLTALIEESLRAATRVRVEMPVCRLGGGVLPGVDLNHNASLLDL